MSPDSRCHSFDERGNGYAKGEGFGVLVLKPLADAVAAGDTIRAVIRSTTTNQDGRTPGLTQPSQAAQEEQIREAYLRGGLNFESTRLFEAHGTGTTLGDPIEARAIKAVFEKYRSRSDPMYVGAVKSNIGHLEAAAGVAGIIKVILCLEKGVIPPNSGFETLNHRIQAEEWHLRFPKKAVPWPVRGLRRASVNSFGYGGSNSHVVLDDAYNYLRLRGIKGNHCTIEEPPAQDTLDNVDLTNGAVINGISNGTHDNNTNGILNHKRVLNSYVFVWSASDATGIERLASVYRDHFSKGSPGMDCPDSLCDLAYTLCNKRSIHPWRSYILASTLEDLQSKLNNIPKPLRSSVPPKLHFIFTGQGAQLGDMGIELICFPVFQQSLIDAEIYFKSLGSHWLLSEELRKSGGSERLNDPALAQPICTALQIALVELLFTWGIRPSGIAGHSSGEIAAAYCVGAISRESAWRIAYFRGALTSRLAMTDTGDRGAMMSVQLSEAELQHHFEQLAQVHGQRGLSIGCKNSPFNTTVTGTETSIDILKNQLDKEGIFARKLRIPVAYHSSHMKVLADEYLNLLQPIYPPKSPILGKETPLFASSVTGGLINPEKLCKPKYWVENLVSTVRFFEAVRALRSKPPDIAAKMQKDYYIEVGPHAVLHRPVKESVQAHEGTTEGTLYESTLRRGVPCSDTLLNLAGKLFVAGYPVRLEKVNSQGDQSRPTRMLSDLPGYPFNHSQRYWLESRLFRNYLQRDSIRHELFGHRSTDWNPSRPRWRQTIRISDSPWLEDHQVNGSVLYPAAGMLAMVIEAARSVSKPGVTIHGYRLRDVTIFNALVIPPKPDGLEIQLYMQNRKNSSSTNISSIECREFCLSSCSGGEWREVCSGTIVTEYVEKSKGIYDPKEDSFGTGNNFRTTLQKILDNCPSTTDRDQFYRTGRQIGYDFGPAFQTLQDIAYDPAGHYAAGTIVLDAWKRRSPQPTQIHEHVIHPTALDGVLQTAAALSSKGGSILGPQQAPTQFRHVWISNDLLLCGANAKLQIAAKTERVALRDMDASIIGLHSRTLEPALLIEGYRATTVTNARYTASERRDIFYSLDWKPDIELLRQSEKERHCLRKVGTRVDWEPSKEMVCLYFMTRALEKLETEKYLDPKSHLQRYMAWVRRLLENLGDQNPLFRSPWEEQFAPENRDTYLDQFAAQGMVERAIYTFCSQLPEIIRGDQDPLDLLFNQGLARDLYADDIFEVSGKRVAALVDLLSHKNPNMDILEIGAGTGSITDPVLSVLSRKGGQLQATPGYNTYTFTDISPSFFEKARDRFTYHNDRLIFKTLDIEQDPAQQGFNVGNHDLVLAANVLHATANISETLQHARSLVKPGGYLILVEVTNKQSIVSNGIWGTLPGWWRGTEEDRQLGPLYSESEWERCLQKNGFTGIELALPDYPEKDHHTISVLVSRANQTEPSQQILPCPLLIVAAETELQSEVANDIASYIESKGSSCEIVHPSSMLTRDGKSDVCVSLLDLESSFLNAMSEENLAILKKMTDSSAKIFWLASGSGSTAQQPENAMASGFGRAIMQEHPGLRFANIEVDKPTKAAEMFTRIFEHSSLVQDSNDWESDYLCSEGIILIPRVFEASDINRFVHSQTGEPELEKRVVSTEPSEALEIRFTTGQLDSFHFARDEIASQPLADDEVEIQVKAAGINFTDVMIVLGQMVGDDIGYECSGLVRRVGAGVTMLSPGDRVCHTGTGTFKTFVRSKEYAVMRIPDSLPFTEVFPAVYLTAVYGIHHLGRLRQGESILIHAAAGAVGQAAIQLAQHIGADVFVTVSSEEKKALVKRLYGIPDDRVFYSRNLSFGRRIMHATNDRGVDVVLNSLSGEGLVESWRVLAPLGRFVEIGKRDIHSFQNLPMHPFSKNVSYHSLDLLTVNKYAPNLVRQMVIELEEILSSGILSAPQPVSVFSRAEFEPALRYLQTGHHMGKAVIDWEAEAEIPLVPSPAPEYCFDPNASYVIAGGLGGIGRSLASWFASRGAKHLILLSRSGPTSEKSLVLLEDLASRGVNVATPRCDVGNVESLRTVLESAAKAMPPIKGCIQGSMVLKDRLLQNMTLDEWQQVLDPKVSGTWNLHNILPRGMDFFIILSSSGGMIGSSGQSQYNAASTFQDAFARYRWSLGEKCTSLDVGVVTGVGYAAENSNIAERWGSKGLQVIYEQELHSVIDWACNPTRNPSSPWLTQIITAVGMSNGEGERDISSLPHLKRPLYRQLLQSTRKVASTTRVAKEKADYGALLRNAENIEEAGSIVASALAKRLSQALSVPLEDVETMRPAHSYGVDSLVAVELRFWFANEMKADISVFNILSNDSIEVLGRFVATKSEHLAKSD
jgi:acyl transferase domain-containing protein/NADPH:quinone reductase-like Zn-dependent oxidoreductase/NADP-dependent 3-hydroxy acid dehydrogenase YdfG